MVGLPSVQEIYEPQTNKNILTTLSRTNKSKEKCGYELCSHYLVLIILLISITYAQIDEKAIKALEVCELHRKLSCTEMLYLCCRDSEIST